MLTACFWFSQKVSAPRNAVRQPRLISSQRGQIPTKKLSRFKQSWFAPLYLKFIVTVYSFHQTSPFTVFLTPTNTKDQQSRVAWECFPILSPLYGKEAPVGVQTTKKTYYTYTCRLLMASDFRLAKVFLKDLVPTTSWEAQVCGPRAPCHWHIRGPYSNQLLAKSFSFLTGCLATPSCVSLFKKRFSDFDQPKWNFEYTLKWVECEILCNAVQPCKTKGFLRHSRKVHHSKPHQTLCSCSISAWPKWKLLWIGSTKDSPCFLAPLPQPLPSIQPWH